MRKLEMLLLSLLIVMAFIAISQQEARAQTIQLKTYTDPEGFYTLRYPSNWTTTYQPSVSKFEEPITWLYVDGKQSANVRIVVFSGPGTQKEFENSFDQTVNAFRNGNDVLQSKFGLYKIDGQNAGAILFQTQQEKSIIVSSVFNGKTIFIEFTTLKSDYNSHIAEVEKVIDSIKITGANRR
jgi:hypothetical protein